GASDAEVREAAAAGRAGGLSLELTLRPEGAALPFDAAAAELGLSHEDAARWWRALGFADPGADSSLRLAPDEVAALRLLSDGAQAAPGVDSALALARLVGATTARIAEAIVDTFRTEFEHPRRSSGVPYVEVVQEYAEVARTLLPPFLDL